MNRAPLICDTGALLDFLVASAPGHAFFRDAIESASARFVPSLVLAELDYFLRDHRAAMRELIADLRRGAFIYSPPTNAQLDQAMEIDARFADLGLGLVGATVVTLAEELDVVRVATRDVADLAAVRLSDGRCLELVTPPSKREKARPKRSR